jgi:hypothetical protein
MTKRKAKQLGSVVFLHPLWVQEFEQPGGIMSEVFVSSAGTDIVYEAEHHTPARTLTSKQYGWLSAQNVEDIKALWAAVGTGTMTITYDDDTTETVRLAREKQLSFSPLWEGKQTYTATIPLAKA